MRNTGIGGQFRRVVRKMRYLSRRDIEYSMGERVLSMPFTHQLPRYQEENPFYDRYYLNFLAKYAADNQQLCLIDIGANVGDTAAGFRIVAPNARIIAVEGSPLFLRYLRRNMAGDRNLMVIERFLRPGPGGWSLKSDGSTGHLVPKEERSDQIETEKYVSVQELLKQADNNAPVIWKSDTDGYDIPILSANFSLIEPQCEIIWIEFDPLMNRSHTTVISHLLDQMAETAKHLVVFDNRGRKMFRLPAAQAADALRELGHWLELQRASGSTGVDYFDVWLLPEPLAIELSTLASELPAGPRSKALKASGIVQVLGEER